MTTNARPMSHANCTHEKTKAARSACRAGRQTPAEQITKLLATDRHRETADAASSKLSTPRTDDMGDGPIGRAVSGFCGNGHHERCPGGGHRWICDCNCHPSH